MLCIGGISQGRKLLNYAKSILGGSCGSTSQCQVFMTYMYFSFFFIPLFKWNKRFYVQMSCCSAIYELEPEIGKAILRGEEPAITSADLHLVQEGKYTRTWQEGAGNPHKKCMRCGFETDEEDNYCPTCGGRIYGTLKEHKRCFKRHLFSLRP